MKKKVLITTSTFPRFKEDTTPSFIYEYASRLSGEFEVIVLCPFARGSKTFEIIDGVKVYRYKYLPFNLGTLAYDGGISPKLRQNPLNFLQVPFFMFFQYVNLIKLVKKYDISVIHAHWIIPQGIAAVFYKNFFNKNVKVLCTAHGTDIYGIRGVFPEILRKFVIKKADKVTCVSNALKNKIISRYKTENISVIPMGIDSEAFSSDKYSRKIREKYGIKGNFLLFVGRLIENKGVNYLIKAIPTILMEFPYTKLVIIGDGPEKNNLVKLTDSLNLKNNIIFVGAILHEKLAAFFATADIFIGPSITSSGGDSEGFGLVFAESMSCETPVITTNLPGIADIVRHDFNGAIIEQKNPDMISQEVIRLLGNPEKAKELGKNGRQFVLKNFEWSIIIDKYKELI